MERAERLRCGKQTKTEWWEAERVDRKVGCVVYRDCSHSKRAVQERWKSTRLKLTLRIGERVPFHERCPSKLAIVSVLERV